ncbi:hypothetical protein TPHA_0D04130 [Tetrapisispora phaffii CBS 4417]|uniref:Mitochondrial carrier protein n=1 Tax=Tetrapisispora phaffii (strain ATCC 24235 / CBS 4417 / NBRC 1672 / NRRL Y-8282 / UCD 70-5) TaxID=1071381 RepID=G8BT75_TETPH|nr:hypothetical protein TPHA_0D04130 [Tetrapisispora phaffii CBS 4417]CCE63046.1 hypothetical protein TPHA_0D04130 [Tetrapisispora phaffii CBS 4417]
MESFENALVGAVSSALANITVYPLDLTKTVIQSQIKFQKTEEKKSEQGEEDVKSENEVYTGTLDCLRRIYMEKGIAGLYQGMSASIVNSFAQTFFYFFCYNVIKSRYSKLRFLLKLTKKKRFSSIEELSLGIVAAILCQVFTTPIAVISTRQQTTGNTEDAKLENIIKDIIKENNGELHGFWKGLKVSMALSVNPSITYTAFGKLNELLIAARRATSKDGNKINANISALSNFFLGMLSKMISTVITQPLIVSKASLQSANSKFSNFQDVLTYLYTSEGLLSLWKGLGPQLAKGVIVQGLLFMYKGEITKCIRHLSNVQKKN